MLILSCKSRCNGIFAVWTAASKEYLIRRQSILDV